MPDSKPLYINGNRKAVSLDKLERSLHKIILNLGGLALLVEGLYPGIDTVNLDISNDELATFAQSIIKDLREMINEDIYPDALLNADGQEG